MATKEVPDKADAVTAVENEEGSIQFFTEMDLDPKGRIKNTYPVYFERNQEQDIKEEIRRIETGIENRYYTGATMGEAMERLKKAKESLDRIQAIRPQFEKQKDSISKFVKELATEISPAMYRRKELAKNLVDAHEEAKKMVEPVIRLTPWSAKVAHDNGIRVTDGKISRDDATRLWQMGREALGESRNVEFLRRD